MRKGDVQVVASQNQVFAHGKSMKIDVAPFTRADLDQSEISSAAADITHQNLLPGLELLTPAVALRVDPGIERGLRLLDQHDPRKSGALRRGHGQLTGNLVERGRNRDHDVLFFQRVLRPAMVPRGANVSQIASADFRWRKLFYVGSAMPREQAGCSVHAGVAEPGLG